MGNKKHKRNPKEAPKPFRIVQRPEIVSPPIKLAPPPAPPPVNAPFPFHVLRTAGTLLGLCLVPNYIPYFENYKVFDWAVVPRVLDFGTHAASSHPIEEEQQHLRPDTSVERAMTLPLIDAAHDLDRFYGSLLKTERKEAGAITRILHYGDSPTTADMITADVRDLLQKQFGDAGHGFALIAKPWAWYGHRGLEIRGSGWSYDTAGHGSDKDGLCGLGAVSFTGYSGARSRIKLRDATHTRVEVSFLQQPDGGEFSLVADDQVLGSVNTRGDETKAGFAAFEIPAGAGVFEIRDLRGKSRVFGMRFEKDTPGLIYSSLGVNGAYISLLARMMDEDHWAEQLRHNKPDLLIINYGTNESVNDLFVDRVFEPELRRVIARIRKATPGTSILIMSPMDRGKRQSTGDIGTVPSLQRLVALEQRVAAAEKCAFFNTFQAMGGPGTMGRWYEAEPRLVGADFIHPMPAGAKMVGNLLYKAVLDGYNHYKQRQLNEGFAKLKD